MQRKKGSKRIQMIIKMVNEFKLAVVHFARPNPMQLCACAWIYFWTKKNCELIRTGPPGLLAAEPHRRPWATVRRAAGLLGRRGPWAAGLLLAKPRYEAFMVTNETAADRQVHVFLAVVRPQAYKLLKNLCDPENPNSKSDQGLK